MNGFEARWNAHSGLYADNLPLFLEDQWVVRNLPRQAQIGPDECVVLLPHQREILDIMFKRDAEGQFAFEEFIYSAPKKSGKTEIGGGIGEWLALVEPGLPEVYFIANDKEQSRTRGFETIRQQIVPEKKSNKIRNPFLATMLRPMRDRIETDDGGFIKTVAVDFAGESGANPTASLWDELWGVDRETQRRLWDEFTPVPTRLNSVRVVTTYAGFTGESELLWDLYERIVGGDKPEERAKRRIHPTLPLFVSADGRSIAYWDDGPEAARMPWQTPEYYAGERGRLRPNAFDRLHLNKWVTNETNFITPDEYDALPHYTPERNDDDFGKRYPIYLSVDAAHKRDCTAATATEFVPVQGPSARPQTRLADHQIWRPTDGSPVIPEETAEPWIRQRIAWGWNIKGITYDPAHFETPAEHLKRDFPHIRIEPTQQSVANLTRMGQALHDAIRFHTFVVYVAADFREHMLNAVAIDTGVGFRLVKGSNAVNKIDAAISEGMGMLMAQTYGPFDAQARAGIWILGGDNDDDDY